MDTSPYTILVVDDEYVNTEFFQVMLSRLGYTVITAGTGDMALEKILTEKPDLVLLDNILPGKTGWEITQLVKSDPEYAEVANTPIIMFSAMDEVEDKVAGFDLGIEDYITKPFNFSEVLVRIQSVLRHKELAQQMLQREKRLVLIESLKKSLEYFTNHMKNPLNEVKAMADAIDITDQSSVRTFVDATKNEVTVALATLQGLNDEIEELRSREDEMKVKELSLSELEEKYRKYSERLLSETNKTD